MSLRVNSITAQLGRLSFDISRTTARFYSSTKKGEQENPGFPRGHGEKIWIFHHFVAGHTAYSFQPVLRATRALRQILVSTRKLKPSKLRKDYWRPLAMIQFPTGCGVVGRSVYQRLRECKTLHQLAWGDEDIFTDTKHLKRHQRAKIINDQMENTVADVAAVLAGTGKGNRMWMDSEEFKKLVAEMEAYEKRQKHRESVKELEKQKEEEKKKEKKKAKEQQEVKTEEDGAEVKEKQEVKTEGVSAEALQKQVEEKTASAEASDEEPVEIPGTGGKSLCRTTIWWMNDIDKNHAKHWTPNVSHELFEDAVLMRIRDDEAPKEEPKDESKDESTGDPKETKSEDAEVAAENSPQKEAKARAP
ncbi:transcriptional regulation of mitochondrial recombination-domain-containing protein [Whalleya microplaca]|nr:transcriptional regulation of mitochondrial recombination-domain-containing protein [Whalleya microplaca]